MQECEFLALLKAIDQVRNAVHSDRSTPVVDNTNGFSNIIDLLTVPLLKWVDSAVITAPLAGATIQTYTLTYSSHVYGLHLATGEANVYILTWTSGGVSRTRRFPFGSAGFVAMLDKDIPLTSGYKP